MSPAEKKDLIRRDHPELSISQQCRLVKLSRSAFYDAPVGIDAATLALMKAIDRVLGKRAGRGALKLLKRSARLQWRLDGLLQHRTAPHRP